MKIKVFLTAVSILFMNMLSAQHQRLGPPNIDTLARREARYLTSALTLNKQQEANVLEYSKERLRVSFQANTQPADSVLRRRVLAKAHNDYEKSLRQIFDKNQWAAYLNLQKKRKEELEQKAGRKPVKYAW